MNTTNMLIISISKIISNKNTMGVLCFINLRNQLRIGSNYIVSPFSGVDKTPFATIAVDLILIWTNTYGSRLH